MYNTVHIVFAHNAYKALHNLASSFEAKFIYCLNCFQHKMTK